MTNTSLAQTEPVLVAIDIAKARHDVLTAVPGKKRRRRDPYDGPNSQPST